MLQTTPKNQATAVPKLKTPLQPTKVCEFEEKEEETPETDNEPKEAQQDVKDEEAVTDVGSETVSAEAETQDEFDPEAKEKYDIKLQQRYAHLSEEDVRSRTHSEMSETSDDRVKFVVGETESDFGSHLDLKGKFLQT